MKDFKNSTKVQYSRGGDVKGGPKGAAKVAKVTADFKKGLSVEGTSARPRDAEGRAATMADLNRANRDTGGMTAAQVKAAGEAVARGNRAPRERIPTDAEASQAMIARKKGGSVGFNSKPLVGKGGLSAMPRGKKC